MFSIANELLSVFFSRSCLACDSDMLANEQHLCTHCRHELPFTHYHEIPENPVERVFYGRVPVRQATALLHFSKDGVVQRMIHALKYRGHTYLGIMLGDWLGHELKQLDTYIDVDIVIPVPLHPIRKMRRGYNQVDGFGKQLARHLNATFSKNHLLRRRFTKKMAFKGRIDRWSSLENTFKVKNPASLKGKHILIVDDIITTGATLEACMLLLKNYSTTISVACMAITD